MVGRKVALLAVRFVVVVAVSPVVRTVAVVEDVRTEHIRIVVVVVVAAAAAVVPLVVVSPFAHTVVHIVGYIVVVVAHNVAVVHTVAVVVDNTGTLERLAAFVVVVAREERRRPVGKASE